MLLLMILASLAAETLAVSSAAPRIKLSTFIKSSAPNKTTSLMKLASLSTTKQKKSSITPLLAVVTPAHTNFPNRKPSPLIKSSPVTSNRIVPRAANMVAVTHNSFNKKKPSGNNPFVESTVAAPETLMKSPAYDDDEPEDLKNLPNSSKFYPVKPGNKPSNKILSEIKTKLQQGNDDYLDKLSGRRRAGELIARSKIVDIMRYEYSKQTKKNNEKERYTLSQNMTLTDNAKIFINSAENRFLKVNRYLRRSGVTTPSQYEIKPYRKHRIHKNRNHADDTRRGRHHRHGHRVRDRLAKRRHDVGLNTKNNVITNPLGITRESAETTPTNKDHMVQPITKLISTLRPHSHETSTPPSTATRPKYETSTSNTTTQDNPPYWKPTKETKASPLAFRANVEKADKRDSHDKGHVDKSIVGPSLTTLSAKEIKSEKKQKKMERFVKFINKNRVLLREFIAKKKSNKAAQRVGKGFFRGGNDHVHPHQLDLSPGKGNKIEALRAKGRLCQRNLMIPEGPKYDSMGSTYMPEFKYVKGHPDYPATKKKRFLIPACCNCCKKSVLGCE